MFALRNLTLVYFFCFFVCMLLNFITDGAFMTTRTGALLFQVLGYSFMWAVLFGIFIFIRFKCPHAFRCMNCGAPLGSSSKSGGKK